MLRATSHARMVRFGDGLGLWTMVEFGTSSTFRGWVRVWVLG